MIGWRRRTVNFRSALLGWRQTWCWPNLRRGRNCLLRMRLRTAWKLLVLDEPGVHGWQPILRACEPDIQRGQQKHAGDEVCEQPADNHNGKRPLRIRPYPVRQ